MAQRHPHESPSFDRHFTLDDLIAVQGVQPVEGELLNTMRTLSDNLWPTPLAAKEFRDFVQGLRRATHPQALEGENG